MFVTLRKYQHNNNKNMIEIKNKFDLIQSHKTKKNLFNDVDEKHKNKMKEKKMKIDRLGMRRNAPLDSTILFKEKK